MFEKKFVVILLVTFFILTGCSMVDKIKEKLNQKSEKKTDSWEDTKEVTSGDDMTFYNKYIAVMNKLQENGDKVYADYISNIPEPNSITKNSMIIPVSFQISVGSLERAIKENKRSFYDGGELSKLNASSEMKQEIETDFKNLHSTMEEYYTVASKVSDYYSKREYRNDLTNVKTFDDEMQNIYDRYRPQINKLSSDLKKFKPKREIRDPNSISDPDEKSSIVMLNAYENILDAAEEFYESYNGLEYKEDLTTAQKTFEDFKIKFNENKNNVLSSVFTDRTKHMKYSFEDYFVKTVGNFMDAGNRFFENAPSVRDEKIYRTSYNDVIDDYNRMIESYNSSINSINMTLKMLD